MSWADSLATWLNSPDGVVCIVHHNIDDLVPDGSDYLSLGSWVERRLPEGWLRLRYDPGGGIRSPDHDEWRSLLQLSGFSDMTPEQRQELRQQGIAEPEPVLPREPHRVLPLLERIMRDSQRRLHLCLVIQYADAVFPEAEFGSLSMADRSSIVTLLRWASDGALATAGVKVVVIARELAGLHRSLRAAQDLITAFQCPLPDLNDRRRFFDWLVSRGGTRLDLTVDTAAKLTGGLRLRELQLLALEGQAAGVTVSVDLIKRWKKQRLESDLSGLVEVIQPRFGLAAIGGLEVVKEYLREIVAAVEQNQPALVPPAITIMGPPGTGKTVLVEALAYECGFNFVRMVNVRERWVGQSERNLWAILQVLRSLAPVVILEDEADESEHSRDEYSGDSGVSNRLRQMRFQFTSDSAIRGQVVWVRLTNRPDRLDLADKRSGRSSDRIPICLPSDAEKAAIFQVITRRHAISVAPREFSGIVAYLTASHGELISGADVEEISLRAYRRAWHAGRTEVTEADYRWAIDDFIPLHQGETLLRMEHLAVAECSSKRFLPERYRGRVAGGEYP